MKTYEYDRPIPEKQPTTPAPSLLDAAKHALDRMDAVDKRYNLSPWPTIALRTAIAAEEAENPCGVSPREVAEADDADGNILRAEVSRLRAENAELRAGLEMLAAQTTGMCAIRDLTLRNPNAQQLENENWVGLQTLTNAARVILAKKESA